MTGGRLQHEDAPFALTAYKNADSGKGRALALRVAACLTNRAGWAARAWPLPYDGRAILRGNIGYRAVKAREELHPRNQEGRPGGAPF